MLAAVLASCSDAHWEEHHELSLDGSGRSVVVAAPELLPSAGSGSPQEAMRTALSGPGLVVEEVREGRLGRVVGEVRFEAVESLCGAPLLRRECGLREVEGGSELVMVLPAGALPSASRTGTGPAPEGAAVTEIRIRPAGRVVHHNGDGPLRRGNVLIWERPLARLRAEGMEIRVRTLGVSVLRTTATTVLRSALIAGGIVLVSLALVVLEGRRRLRRHPSGVGRN